MYRRWSFRRVLHAYLTLQGERNAPFAMLLDAFDSGAPAESPKAQPGKAPPARARRADGRPPYPWWKPQPRSPRSIRKTTASAHVEDPVGAIAAAGLPVAAQAPYKRRGDKVERQPTSSRGAGVKTRRRVSH